MEAISKDLILTRVLDAPRELVFKAWTDPALVAQWWGPRGVTNSECDVDARVGGRIHVVMLAGAELGPMAGQRWPMQGEIRELEAPAKLVFTNQAVNEASGAVMIDAVTTVTLEEAGGGKSKLTVQTTAKGLVAQAAQMLEGMEPGWTQSLDKLGEQLASWPR